MKKQFLLISLIALFSGAIFGQDSIAKAPSIKAYIFGNMDFNMFVASLLFALVGVLISLLLHATTRDQNSESTPVKFSFLFMLKDNWKRILLSIILVIVTIRFLKELTGLELNMFFSLCIGLVYDKLAEYLKSKSDILKVNRTEMN